MDPKLAASLSHFAVQFGKELQNGKTQVCSPLSAQAVLALTALGSRGDTHAELLRAMALPDDEALRSLFSYVTSSMKSVEGISLKMANKVYVTNRGTLKPGLQKGAEEVFGSALEQLDFTEKEAAAGVVNKWVAEQTHNMIGNIVDPNSLNDDTRLLLINAIYFQGFWEQSFLKKATRDRPFHVNLTTDINVPTMSMRDVHFRYKHSQELQAQFLEMHYKGRQASMVLVVPDAVEGLGDLLQQLAAGHDLMAELANMESTLLDVFIPKFKIETEIDLTRLLPKMGIKTIFDEDKADIQMLTSNEPLYVSQAIQKAVIEVDEAGTKAAVVTMCRMVPLCARSWSPPTKQFKADRPFLYLLKAGQILMFWGVYYGSKCTAAKDFCLSKPLPTTKEQ